MGYALKEHRPAPPRKWSFCRPSVELGFEAIGANLTIKWARTRPKHAWELSEGVLTHDVRAGLLTLSVHLCDSCAGLWRVMMRKATDDQLTTRRFEVAGLIITLTRVRASAGA